MLIRLIGIFFLCIAQPSLADFQSGQAEYDKGNFKLAYEIWLPAAKNGDAASQTSIGILFDNGEGFEEDNKEAVKWFGWLLNKVLQMQRPPGNNVSFGEGVDYTKRRLSSGIKEQ